MGLVKNEGILLQRQKLTGSFISIQNEIQLVTVGPGTVFPSVSQDDSDCAYHHPL